MENEYKPGHGAPLGNENSGKGKRWSAALERAVERMADPTIDPDVPLERNAFMRGIDDLADRFIAATRASDLGYFKEFGDRIEGKPHQTVGHSGDVTVVIDGSDANL